jgi:hypothetical protein
MTKYENQTLQNKVLVMEDCFYSGGDVEWTNVQFQACRWHFRGPALKTIQLAQILGMTKDLPTVPQGPVSSSKMN